MKVLIGLAAIPFSALLIWLGWKQLTKLKRARLRKQPVSTRLINILNRNVGIYSQLPDDLKSDLHGHINVFLVEKQFIGCDGLEVSFDGHLEVHRKTTRAGESWYRGPVVLSWKDVLRGAANVGDGYNVVLHEFAHKLDEENNGTNGLPVLQEREHYGDWAKVLGREYELLESRVARGRNRVLHEYGLTSPPEFFAVATESFFEKPAAMRDQLPDLYDQLRIFYRLDPATWTSV